MTLGDFTGALDGVGDPPEGPLGGYCRPVDDTTVALAVTLVDNMEVLDKLDEWEADDRKGPGGRPVLFPKRAVLVGIVICAITDQPLQLTRVYDVLFHQLSATWRAELGIPSTPGPDDVLGQEAAYRNVRTRFHAILDLIDPSPAPKSRRLTEAELTARTAESAAERSEEEWRLREERLEWLANRILEASIRLLPRGVRRAYGGSVGVDATVVPSFARGPSRHRQSADPDGGWYVRQLDGEGGGDGDGGERYRDKPIYGYEATIAVSGSDDPQLSPFPALAMGMSRLHRPGQEPGRNGVRPLASIRGRGYPANFLGVDRAYSSAKAEDFQLRIAALGYSPLYDYKKDQLGVQANCQGFLQVEGTWYSPMMPEALINATADLGPKRIDQVTYERRIEERRNYEARWKSQPDAEGYGRLECPAAGWPLVRCDMKPRSVRRSTQGKLHIIIPDTFRSTAPPCCTQASVTVPPEAGAKFRQAVPYATPEWERRYYGLRNASEGYHGFVKDQGHQALGDPERRRVHGVAAQTFFTALLLMAANVRKIRAFLEKMAEVKGKLSRLPRRRKGKSLDAWLPADPEGPDGPDPPLGA